MLKPNQTLLKPTDKLLVNSISFPKRNSPTSIKNSLKNIEEAFKI